MDETKEIKPPEQKSRMSFSMFLLLLLFNITVSASAVIVYDSYFAQKVAYIDIKEYLQERRKLIMSGEVEDRDFSKSIANIENALKKAGNRTVILKGDAVVRNAEKINIDN
jgi:hypothetical protein